MARLDVQIRDPGVALLRFVNQPTGLLTGEMAVELEAQVQQLADDDAVRVVILTGGQPDVFIRHFDVAELAMAAEAVLAFAWLLNF